MTLLIQSNIPGHLDVWLVAANGQLRHSTRRIQYHGSEFLLSLIDQLLRRQGTSLDQVKKIIVVQGPGPFTAVRTGIVVGNTLGFVLQVPVLGVRSTKSLTADQVMTLAKTRAPKRLLAVHPWYGKQPNITKAG